MALSQQAKIREETPGPSAGGPGVLPTPHLAEQACDQPDQLWQHLSELQ
jgi:hypothetical protein